MFGTVEFWDYCFCCFVGGGGGVDVVLVGVDVV